MDEFNLEILTPVRKYLSMKAETIIVDTDDGQRSFYSKMYDLITPLKICPLTIKYKGHITNYAIGGGTLSIDSKRNTITILVNSIESYKEIDESRAKANIKEAEKLKLEAVTKRDIIEAERKLLRSLNRLNVISNYKDF